VGGASGRGRVFTGRSEPGPKASRMEGSVGRPTSTGDGCAGGLAGGCIELGSVLRPSHPPLQISADCNCNDTTFGSIPPILLRSFALTFLERKIQVIS